MPWERIRVVFIDRVSTQTHELLFVDLVILLGIFHSFNWIISFWKTEISPHPSPRLGTRPRIETWKSRNAIKAVSMNCPSIVRMEMFIIVALCSAMAHCALSLNSFWVQRCFNSQFSFHRWRDSWKNQPGFKLTLGLAVLKYNKQDLTDEKCLKPPSFRPPHRVWMKSSSLSCYNAYTDLHLFKNSPHFERLNNSLKSIHWPSE